MKLTIGWMILALVAAFITVYLDRKWIRHAVARTLYTKEKRPAADKRKGIVTLQPWNIHAWAAFGLAVLLTVFWPSGAYDVLDSMWLFAVKFGAAWLVFNWGAEAVSTFDGAKQRVSEAMARAQEGDNEPAGRIAASAGAKIGLLRKWLRGIWDGIRAFFGDVRELAAEDKPVVPPVNPTDAAHRNGNDAPAPAAPAETPARDPRAGIRQFTEGGHAPKSD
ncbi:MAG TPA: hypothetical protein VJJ47_01515 [Candidatus Paceibacterota bacterium]